MFVVRINIETMIFQNNFINIAYERASVSLVQTSFRYLFAALVGVLKIQYYANKYRRNPSPNHQNTYRI